MSEACRPVAHLGAGVLVLALTACASGPAVPTAPPGQSQGASAAGTAIALPAVSAPARAASAPDTGVQRLDGWGPTQPPAAVPKRPVGQWVAVDWDALPGWRDDPLEPMWDAWLRSCARAVAPWARLCPQVRALSLADDDARRAWLQQALQPYRVESADGKAQGLLTAYFEPAFEARRERADGWTAPLYAPPSGVDGRRPWFTREQIDTLPAAQAALADRVIAWLADPLQALVLHIQGSGRLRITEADGSTHEVRLAFAGHNGHPYQSVGRWLLDQGLLRDASWPGIRAWLLQNPDQVDAVLWRNPRYVFFREEALPPGDADAGPRGAQGVALSAGRSIAVDPRSVPYGTPVWLVSNGAAVDLARWVVAQDTGAAITGAVRADYYAGGDAAAAELAGRLKQPLALWVLWPR